MDENFAILKTYGWTSARRRSFESAIAFKHNSHSLRSFVLRRLCLLPCHACMYSFSFSRLHTSMPGSLFHLWCAFLFFFLVDSQKHFFYFFFQQARLWKVLLKDEGATLRLNNVEWLFGRWDALSTVFFSFSFLVCLLIPHHDNRPRFTRTRRDNFEWKRWFHCGLGLRVPSIKCIK